MLLKNAHSIFLSTTEGERNRNENDVNGFGNGFLAGFGAGCVGKHFFGG